MRKQAFTLVELLLVVAIVALLISILLPALNKAKGVVNGVVCGSHLRQISLAMFTYSNDHDDRIPYAAWRAPDNINFTWDDLLGQSGYDGRFLSQSQVARTGLRWSDPRAGGLYHCPEDASQRTGSPNGPPRSYAMNDGFQSNMNGFAYAKLDRTPKAAHAYGVTYNAGGTTSNGAWSARRQQIEQPAWTIVTTEYPRNINRTTGNSIGSILGHGVGTTQRNPGVQLISTHDTPEPPWHGSNTQFNYAMADGHIELLQPAATANPNASVYPTGGSLKVGGAWTMIAADD